MCSIIYFSIIHFFIFSTGKADYLECLHVASTGQPGNQAQSSSVYQRQVVLDAPNLFLQQGDAFSG